MRVVLCSSQRKSSSSWKRWYAAAYNNVRQFQLAHAQRCWPIEVDINLKIACRLNLELDTVPGDPRTYHSGQRLCAIERTTQNVRAHEVSLDYMICMACSASYCPRLGHDSLNTHRNEMGHSVPLHACGIHHNGSSLRQDFVCNYAVAVSFM